MNVGLDMTEFDAFVKHMGRMPPAAQNAVRKSNRKWASKLRDLIKRAAPRTRRSKRQGPKHDTPTGNIARATRSKASTSYAMVIGDGSKAPHYIVQELGGGVYWTRASSGKSARDLFGHKSSEEFAGYLAERGVKGHAIPVKPRNPEGYFFFPTGERHVDEIAETARDEALNAIKASIGGYAAALSTA